MQYLLRCLYIYMYTYLLCISRFELHKNLYLARFSRTACIESDDGRF